MRPTPGSRPVVLQTQTSQLEETVDEAIVVQVQDIPTVDLNVLGLSSIETPESTWELSLLKNLFASLRKRKCRSQARR